MKSMYMSDMGINITSVSFSPVDKVSGQEGCLTPSYVIAKSKKLQRRLYTSKWIHFFIINGMLIFLGFDQ